MAECPLADECPSFSERIEGMGCQYYGDRGGKEWCNHYSQPISELKTAPVVPGEEIVIEVEDMHESGAGVGRHQDTGFIVMVDGVLPPARVRVKVTSVKPNFARADLVEKLPEEDVEGEEGEDGDAESEDESGSKRERAEENPRLGSRENFWGG